MVPCGLSFVCDRMHEVLLHLQYWIALDQGSTQIQLHEGKDEIAASTTKCIILYTLHIWKTA